MNFSKKFCLLAPVLALVLTLITSMLSPVMATTVSDDPIVQQTQRAQEQKRLKPNKSKQSQQSMTQLQAKPNGSGIAVSYAFDAAPQVGKPVVVTLQFDGVTAQDAQVSWTLDAGLQNPKQTGDQRTVYKSALKANGTNKMQLTIIPTVAGWAYLNVFTTQNGMSDAQAIGIKTGPAVMAVNGALSKTPQGETVILMKTK